jgi:hypothetical protein
LHFLLSKLYIILFTVCILLCIMICGILAISTTMKIIQSYWRMPSSGMWRPVDLVNWTDVSEEHVASIFRVEKSASEEPAWVGGKLFTLVLFNNCYMFRSTSGTIFGSFIKYVPCYWDILIQIRIRVEHHNHIVHVTIMELYTLKPGTGTTRKQTSTW